MIRLAIFICFLLSCSSPAQNTNSLSREAFEATAPPNAPLLQPVRDGLFGSPVTRIAGDAGSPVTGTDILWSRPARHIYSSVAPWDCSDSLLAIRNAGATKGDGSGAREWLLLDGRTFRPRVPLRRAFIEFRWWNTRPGRMLLIDREGLFDYDPVKDLSRPIPSSSLFSRYQGLTLNGQGNLSNDDRIIVFTATARDTGTPQVIAFSLEDGAILSEIPMAIPRLDYATISPSGKSIVIVGEFVRGEADRTRIHDLDGSRIGEQWDPYGTPSHYDLALDENGREIAVGVAKSRLPGIDPGSVIARDLASGEIRLLLAGGYASHVSCRNLKKPGWAFVSYPETDLKTYPPFSNELVAVRTDGSGKFRRCCQFHSVPGDYWAQPQAAPNSAGTLAVFASNWGDAQRRAEAFVVDLEIAPAP